MGGRNEGLEIHPPATRPRLDSQDCLPGSISDLKWGQRNGYTEAVYSPSNLWNSVSSLSLHNHHRHFLLPRAAAVAAESTPILPPKVQALGPKTWVCSCSSPDSCPRGLQPWFPSQSSLQLGNGFLPSAWRALRSTEEERPLFSKTRGHLLQGSPESIVNRALGLKTGRIF